jgi:hypothetical protein
LHFQGSIADGNQACLDDACLSCSLADVALTGTVCTKMTCRLSLHQYGSLFSIWRFCLPAYLEEHV